jgi:apolipoprotein N-acyltransferase
MGQTASTGAAAAGRGTGPGPWWAWLAGGLWYGLALTLSLPAVSWWFMALVALAPLGALMLRAARDRAASPVGAAPGRAGLWARLTAGRVWWRALLAGMGAVPAFLYLNAFMADVTGPGYPLVCLYLGVWVGIGVWLCTHIAAWTMGRRWPAGVASGVTTAAVGLVWVGVEFWRGQVFLIGFPWYYLGHGMIEPISAGWWPTLAPLAGMPADGWVVAMINLWLAAAVTGPVAQRRAGVSGAVAPVAVAVVAGTAVQVLVVQPAVQSAQGRGWPVLMVQTNLPQNNKTFPKPGEEVANFDRWLELTERTAKALQPGLVAWPETMVPGRGLNPEAVAEERRLGIYMTIPDAAAAGPGGAGGQRQLPGDYFHNRLVEMQARIGVPMLVGAVTADGLRFEQREGGGLRPKADARFNSVVLVEGGRVAERYDKMVLTPFGEVIPIAWRFPAVQQQLLNLGAQGMRFDLGFGQRPHVFSLAGPVGPQGGERVRVVTPICFEQTYSHQCRLLTYADGVRRADLLLNASNDGWFAEFTPGRGIHMLTGRWRTLELGLPMVRSVNTGLSAIIDSRGRVLASGVDGAPGRAGERVEGVLSGVVPLPPAGYAGTPFGRWLGDVAGWAGVTLAAVSLLLRLWAGRRR